MADISKLTDLNGDEYDIKDATARTSLTGKEDTSNKVTSLSSASTNTQYPSAKCMYDILGNVENALLALR